MTVQLLETPMTQTYISHKRLVNHQVAQPTFTQPGEVVRWLGAVQAQDYLGALWAIGARMPDATEQAIEQALAEKRIVRTWPMRGTIHFVAPADVRWMLELLTPRVVQGSQSRLRQLGIDTPTLVASANVIAKALQGGKQIPRSELYTLLEEANIAASGQRGLHILGQLAHQGLICFGARAGKQPTFTLLDEWAPDAKSLPRDEALATLALRYFTSHGPATVQDLVWWAGLTVGDARTGLGAVADQLVCEEIDGQQYYFAENAVAGSVDPSEAFLLPPFDEFLVSYRNRSAALDPQYNQLIVPGGNGIFNPIVVINGEVLGTWKRAFKKNSVVLTFSAFTAFDDAHMPAIHAAAERYGRFVGKTVVIEGQR